MQLTDFDYQLPKDLIAQYPLELRSASRLLDVIVQAPSQEVLCKDLIFTDIVQLLQKGDLLIFNDTKVIPARVFGSKDTGGKVELLIERVLPQNCVLAQIKASKPPKPGSLIYVGSPDNQACLQVLSRHQNANQSELAHSEISPFYDVQFPSSVLDFLDQYGVLPLPPYIHHDANQHDAKRYQTVVANQPGSVAAPTAGLHFDEPLLEKIQSLGIQIAHITLHIGAGTFSPVRHEDLSKHQMHFEQYFISPKTRAAIDLALAHKRRIVAVGTTSLRALESAFTMGDQADTNLFITPGYQFQVVDALITNFHLPKSTLLMLVSAFAGTSTIQKVYQHAIAQQYRFFSYGDAMFLRKS